MRRAGGAGAAPRRGGRNEGPPPVADIIDHLCTDPRLEAVVREVGEYAIGPPPAPGGRYGFLVELIITQQLSGRAAGAITSRFKALYGGALPAPADVLATPDEDLRATGMSRMKVSYVKDLSGRVASGRLSLGGLDGLSDEEAVARLTEVRGVGRWTAEIFLIFAMGRLDVLPVGDLWFRKGVKEAYSLRLIPDEREAARIAERWRPYRSVAVWYLWKYQPGFDRA